MSVPMTTEREISSLFVNLCDLYDHDREIRAIIVEAQHKIDALAFNRFADRQTARAMRSTRRAALLRHKGRTARQEGRTHA